MSETTVLMESTVIGIKPSTERMLDRYTKAAGLRTYDEAIAELIRKDRVVRDIKGRMMCSAQGCIRKAIAERYYCDKHNDEG